MDYITSIPYWLWWIVAVEALALAALVASFEGSTDDDDKQRRNYRR